MVVSTDPSAINKIRSVLEAQFDLEILLKRRELAAIKMELERGEECIEELRFLVSQDFQPRIRRVHAPDITAEFIPEPSPPPKPKKQTKRIPRKPAKESNTTPLYSRSEDGTYVKMFCPDCNRCNFATLQGFVNHCRIAHRLEFPNIEQCHRECGTHVDESEVPADHPCRRRHTGGSGIRRANRVQKAQPSTARKSKPTATTTTPSVAVTTPEKTKKPATAKKSVNKPRKAPVEHKIEVQEEEIDLDLDEDMIQEANMNFEREVSAAATKSVSTGFPVAPRSGKKYPTSMSRIFTDSSSNSEKNDSSSSDSDVSSSDSSSPSTSPVRKTVVQSYPRKRPAPRFISEDEDSDSDCYEYHKRRAAEVYQKFVDRSDRGRLYQTEQQYCQTQEIR